MIKNKMLARNCLKGKGPILTMAIQLARVVVVVEGGWGNVYIKLSPYILVAQ